MLSISLEDQELICNENNKGLALDAQSQRTPRSYFNPHHLKVTLALFKWIIMIDRMVKRKRRTGMTL